MYTESMVALPLLVDSLQLIVYRGLEEFVKSSQIREIQYKKEALYKLSLLCSVRHALIQ